MNSNVYTELVTVARVYQQFEESATTLLQFAVVPVLKILILCAFGLGLASSYVNILPAQCRKLLSKVSPSKRLLYFFTKLLLASSWFHYMFKY